MFETIRTISNTEVGLTYLVSQHYEDTILKRGMEALREEIKEKPGHSFLVKLGEIWSNFYQNILPTLLSLFYCIPTHGNSVKQITLLSFRNMVLLQLKIDEALSANDSSVPKSIKQMLCVLLQVFCICLSAGVTFLLFLLIFVFENNMSDLVILRYFLKCNKRKLTYQ